MSTPTSPAAPPTASAQAHERRLAPASSEDLTRTIPGRGSVLASDRPASLPRAGEASHAVATDDGAADLRRRLAAHEHGMEAAA